jgi:Flp pilus assembly protein TadD
MLARLALVAAAAVLVVLLASSLRGYDACRDARQTVIGAATGALPADRQAAATATVADRCRGAAGIISVAAVLHRQGREAEAQRLAQRAADEEPDNATAWNALAVSAQSAGDGVTARRAAREAVRLSPLDPPPVPLGAAGP